MKIMQNIHQLVSDLMKLNDCMWFGNQFGLINDLRAEYEFFENIHELVAISCGHSNRRTCTYLHLSNTYWIANTMSENCVRWFAHVYFRMNECYILDMYIDWLFNEFQWTLKHFLSAVPISRCFCPWFVLVWNKRCNWM